MSNEFEKFTDHEYDGIRELDNPLPMWWMITFFVTIIFGFLYWIHYEFGGGQNQNQELAADLQAIEKLKIEAAPEAPVNEDDEFKRILSEGKALTEGRAPFEAKCAACHGAQLQGLIGPNLTDEYWLHGKGTPQDIANTIRKGIPEKGMPAWENLVSPNEVRLLAVFIYSSFGSKPSLAKAPQGDKVERN